MAKYCNMLNRQLYTFTIVKHTHIIEDLKNYLLSAKVLIESNHEFLNPL